MSEATSAAVVGKYSQMDSLVGNYLTEVKKGRVGELDSSAAILSTF